MYAGEIGPVATICCIVVLAMLLRATRSWPVVLTALPVIVGSWCLGLLFVAPEFVAQLLEQLQLVMSDFFARLNEQRAAQQQEPVQMGAMPDSVQLLGMFGLMQVLTCTLSLMLARWWQSLLYNPGGFQQEFHVLRLDKMQVVALVAGLVLLSSSEQYQFWSWLFAVPLVLAGIALVHGLVAQMGLAGQWLVLFYVALVLFAPLTPFVMMMAIADSAVDFRQRWKGPGPD